MASGPLPVGWTEVILRQGPASSHLATINSQVWSQGPSVSSRLPPHRTHPGLADASQVELSRGHSPYYTILIVAQVSYPCPSLCLVSHIFFTNEEISLFHFKKSLFICISCI